MSVDHPVEDASGGQVLDREKLRALYDQHWRSLVLFLVKNYGATFEVAEDAVSDVLSEFLAQADAGTPAVAKTDIVNFLRNAVRNTYLDHAKRPHAGGVDKNADLDLTIDASSRRGDSILIAQEMLDKVRARWNELPEEERKLLTLVDQEGLDIREAAQRLAMNPDAAYTVYARAHRTLEEELGKSWSTYILPASGDTYKPRTREGLLKKASELPPEYREILHLSLAERLGTDDLAQRLSLSPGAAKERLARGLEYLQKKTGMSMDEIEAALRNRLGH